MTNHEVNDGFDGGNKLTTHEAFDRFLKFAKQVISLPKTEIDRRKRMHQLREKCDTSGLKLGINRVFARAKEEKAEEDDGELEGMRCQAPSAKGKIAIVAPDGGHEHLECQRQGHGPRGQTQREANAATAFDECREQAPHGIASMQAKVRHCATGVLPHVRAATEFWPAMIKGEHGAKPDAHDKQAEAGIPVETGTAEVFQFHGCDVRPNLRSRSGRRQCFTRGL